MANWKKARETVSKLRESNSFDKQVFMDDLTKMMQYASLLAEVEASDDYFVQYVGKDIFRKLYAIYVLVDHVRNARLDLFTYISTGAFLVEDDEEEKENG